MAAISENLTRKSFGSGAEQNGRSPNVEVTVDVQDGKKESAQNVKTAAFDDGGGSEVEGSEQRTKRLQRLTATVLQLSSVTSELKRSKSASWSSRKSPGGASARISRLKSTVKFITKTGGDSGWADVEEKFNEITKDTNGVLHRSKFGECIGMKTEKFALELFDALARKREITGEAITKDQLKEFWDQITDESFESRLQTFFDMIDKDADGKLTKDEVKEIIRLSADANQLFNIRERADEYAAFIMEELEQYNHEYIMIYDIEDLLLQASTTTAITREKTISSRRLSQKHKPTQHLNPLMQRFRDMGYFVLDNSKRIWVMALWLTVMAVLFAYKFIQYKRRAVYQVMGNCVCVAKGAGETLKLNMALILLPVCRNTLTWLRNNTRLGSVVPFDDNINFHMIIAAAIAIGVGIHVIFHMICDFPRLLTATPEAYSPLKQYFGDVQPTSYWHFVNSVDGITGILIFLLMAIAFTLATPWFRRRKLNKHSRPLEKLASFNAFWYTHHLFIIVYALLIVHGYFLYLTHEWYKKTTWMYLAVPVTLYACERLIRLFRSNIKEVKVINADPDLGKVLGLYMSRPDNFIYKSGQYLFVKCPAVSPFEWHPFSITSAPQDDYLSINIKNQGDWTEAIIDLFSKVPKPPPCEVSGPLRADNLHRTNNPNPNYPEVMIDGPYGAPAQEYKKYEVVLLVGLGIGATPMISIVKDIVNNIKAEEEVKPSQMESGESQVSEESFKTCKAYFYWITPEQCSFDWFKNIMNEVAEHDHNHVIELHNYCSRVYEEGDVRSAFIAMLQSLYYSKKGFDIVSKTRVMCHFAKPKWWDVYKNIEKKHPNTEVGVFYCGVPKVAKELKHLARYFTHNNDMNTRFTFHKENF